MTEQIAQANGIEIAYETFGDPERPAILLVMGLGVQMLGWPDEFCELLADRGFREGFARLAPLGCSRSCRGLPGCRHLGPCRSCRT